MNCEDFRHFLGHELCWLDGVPTHPSSARQRQCPHCRTKWSYERLQSQWRLAEMWAAGFSRQAAAKECGVDIHTVGRLFSRVESRVAKEYLDRIRRGDRGISPESEEVVQTCLRLRNLRSKRAVDRHVAELAVRHQTIDERLERIFRLCFLDDLRRRIAPTLGRKLNRAKKKPKAVSP